MVYNICVKEGSERSSTGSEKEIRGDIQFGSNRENRIAKEVHDKGANRACVGDGCNSVVDVRVVEAEEFEG